MPKRPVWMGDRRMQLVMAGTVVAVVVVVVIVAIVLSLSASEGPNGKFNPPSSTSHGVLDTPSAANQTAAEYTAVNAGPIVDLYGRWYDGDGTYYGSEGEGTCQISKSNLPPAARNSEYLVALNAPQFLGSAACGMCFRVQGSGEGKGSDPITGDFIVFVKDLCPECHQGDVDFAVDGDGRWDIKIRALQCPVGNTALQYWFQGSNPFYVKLQIRNARVPAHRVEVQSRQGNWVELQLTRDGHWQGSAQTDVNIPVRLTSITGAVLKDVIPRLENGVVMEGLKSVQFPLDSSLPQA